MKEISEALIPVMLNEVASTDLTLMLAGTLADGLAADEYTLPATLTIARGNRQATLRVLLTDDGIDETDETLTIALNG